MGTHYSLAFEHTKLASWATRAADALSAIIGEENPIFCYSGYSGITHGQAIARAWIALSREFGEAYARKAEEKSHGRGVEWGFSSDAARRAKKQVLVFVDDFISSGKTRGYVLATVRKDFEFLKLPEHWFEVTAVSGGDDDRVQRCEPMPTLAELPGKIKEACETFTWTAPSASYVGRKQTEGLIAKYTITKPQTAVEFKAMMVDALREFKRDQPEKYGKSSLDWIPKDMLFPFGRYTK